MQSPFEPYQSLYFVLGPIRILELKEKTELRFPHAKCNALLSVLNGHVAIAYGGNGEYSLSEDTCLLLPFHEAITLEPAAADSVSPQVYVLFYDSGSTGMLAVREEGSRGKRQDERKSLLEPKQPMKVQTGNMPDFSHQLRMLYKHRRESADSLRLANHIRFQHVMLELVKLTEGTAPEGGRDSHSAVKASIDKLHSTFNEDISVERLAASAEIGRWQYAKLFKEITGRQVLDYIADLRIAHAKKLLAGGKPTMREVAQACGFHDEYYFNRRFKQLVGISPKRYGTAPERIVALHHAAFMLALGVEPVGMYDFLRLGIYKQRMENIASAGGYRPDLQRLAALKPDIIVGWQAMGDHEVDDMAAIAPVVRIPNGDAFEVLRHIAELLGKQEAETRWLELYRRKESRVREQLRHLVQDGETAVVYHAWNDHIDLMPNTGLFPSFYQAAGFKKPPWMTGYERNRMVERGKLAPEDVLRYDADRIFIADESDGGRMTALIRKAVESLPVSRRRKIYSLDIDWYYGYDPLALEWQLEQLPKLLGGTGPSGLDE